MKNLFTKLFQSRSNLIRQNTHSFPPNPKVRSQYGVPPNMSNFFGDLSVTEDPKWNYELWLEEWAESYLGTVQFNCLRPRFASIPGITSVAHTDKEIFLIRSELEAGQLKELLWHQFVEAAKLGDSSN